eukprot:1163668-Amphidinium_carterae.1
MDGIAWGGCPLETPPQSPKTRNNIRTNIKVMKLKLELPTPILGGTDFFQDIALLDCNFICAKRLDVDIMKRPRCLTCSNC